MSRISDVTFKYYEIWYQNRNYQILIPDDVSQLWIIHYPYIDKFTGMNVDLIGNKKGFEAMIHACDILSQDNNLIVYFPCKKNTRFPHHYFERPSSDLGEQKDDFLKEIFRFDTVFYLTPRHGYFRWISILERFLRPDIEDIFLEDISTCSDCLRGEGIDYFIHGIRHKQGFTGEIGMVFWDNDIEKAAKLAAKRKLN